MSPLPLRYLPWIHKSQYPLSIRQHPYKSATLQIFPLMARNYEIASTPGTLTRVEDNPEFSPRLRKKMIPTTNNDTLLLAFHCMQNGVIKSRESLWTLCLVSGSPPMDIPTTSKLLEQAQIQTLLFPSSYAIGNFMFECHNDKENDFTSILLAPNLYQQT